MPKLSIITINYNNLEGLEKTAQSVFNQTWKEFEYIVIDGGSTDGSANYLDSQKDKIDYWISEPDNGVYHAMNKGILKASGEYLLFLNSGDHFYNIDVLLNNRDDIVDYDLIYFNVALIEKGKQHIYIYPDKLNFSFFYEGTICHQSTLIKKQLFDKVGLYDESLTIVSDWKLFILALFKFNCSSKKINSTLTTYYLDGFSSDPKNKNLARQERSQILKSNFSVFLDDFKEFERMVQLLEDLRKSKKIQLLQKLSWLKKF